MKLECYKTTWKNKRSKTCIILPALWVAVGKYYWFQASVTFLFWTIGISVGKGGIDD